jgi:hypothetical protein
MINEGTLDRTIRIVLGLAILSLAFIGPKSALGYIGVVPVVTGLIGFCPAYRLFGLSTCPVTRKQA